MSDVKTAGCRYFDFCFSVATPRIERISQKRAKAPLDFNVAEKINNILQPCQFALLAAARSKRIDQNRAKLSSAAGPIYQTPTASICGREYSDERS